MLRLTAERTEPFGEKPSASALQSPSSLHGRGRVQGRTARNYTTFSAHPRTFYASPALRGLFYGTLIALAMWVGLAALVVVGGIWPVQTVLVVCILGIVVGIWRLFRPGVRR